MKDNFIYINMGEEFQDPSGSTVFVYFGLVMLKDPQRMLNLSFLEIAESL